MSSRWGGRFAPNQSEALRRNVNQPVIHWERKWVTVNPSQPSYKVLKWVSTKEEIVFNDVQDGLPTEAPPEIASNVAAAAAAAAAAANIGTPTLLGPDGDGDDGDGEAEGPGTTGADTPASVSYSGGLGTLVPPVSDTPVGAGSATQSTTNNNSDSDIKPPPSHHEPGQTKESATKPDGFGRTPADILSTSTSVSASMEPSPTPFPSSGLPPPAESSLTGAEDGKRETEDQKMSGVDAGLEEEKMEEDKGDTMAVANEADGEPEGGASEKAGTGEKVEMGAKADAGPDAASPEDVRMEDDGGEEAR